MANTSTSQYERMQHALHYHPPEFEFAQEPSFNVVIAYEDFETGKHAKRTYDVLVEKLDMDCAVNNQMWKFDVLKIPKLREIAVEDVAAADMVIISCHGEELPAYVKSWIESWLRNKSKTPLALVALFNRPGDHASQAHAVRAYLADVARRGHMEFFAQPDGWPHRNGQPAPLEQDFTDSKEKTFSAVAGVVLRGLPVSS